MGIAALWQRFAASGLVTGAWRDSPWDDLPADDKQEFLDLCELVREGRLRSRSSDEGVEC